MGRNIEDIDRHKDATDDVASDRKKDEKAIRRVNKRAERDARRVTLDDIEDTIAAGANETMGMSQNTKEERSNRRSEKR